jgi:hypothetical protein
VSKLNGKLWCKKWNKKSRGKVLSGEHDRSHLDNVNENYFFKNFLWIHWRDFITMIIITKKARVKSHKGFIKLIN